MTICPFCKKAVVNAVPGGPCPSCGKVDPHFKAAAPAAAVASSAGDDWDEIERGSGAGAPSGPSSYSGGGMGGLGDDDGGPSLSLELDAPQRSLPPNSIPQQQPPPVSHPPNSGGQQQQQQQQRGAGASGGYPKYASEPMPQPLPARSGRPSSDPSMHQQQSSPNMAPPPSMPSGQQPQMAPPSVAALPQGAYPQGADPAAMIARYPAPPAKVWESPLYAMRVLWRQFELRQDIASLKKRRSPDVPLYERALKTHDGTHFMIGLAMTAAALTVATFLFFLPVIIRFVRDAD